MTPPKNGRRFWDIASKVLVYVVCAMGAAVVAHEVRISRIETSAFTVEDAHQLEWRLLEPPGWLQDQIKDIKISQREILTRLRELERGG